MSNPANLPFHGIRIVELTSQLAGSLTAQLLGDQGADVVAIHPPGYDSEDLQHSVLMRNKSYLELDLESQAGQQEAFTLIERADVLISNWRPGVMDKLGFNKAQLQQLNPSLICLSLPGFSETDEEHKQLAATEGLLAAYSGLFREISPVRDKLGLPPVYTPLPLPSVYAAVHGATAVGAALIARHQDGGGEFIEVPLFDAAMSALSGLLMKIEDQPLRYDVPPLPKNIQQKVIPAAAKVIKHLPGSFQEKVFSAAQSVMPPLFQNYPCRDGRLIFICALEHKIQTVNALKTFGIYDTLKDEGLKFGSPMDNSGSTDNVMNIALLSQKWKFRIKKLIAKAALQKDAAEWETLLEENKVPAGLVRTSDEWLDIPVMNEKGLFVDIPQQNGQSIRQPGPLAFFNEQHPASYLQKGKQSSLDSLLEHWPERAPLKTHNPDFDRSQGLLSGRKIIDLANVIAGPVATRTLAELGAEVIKVDSPDPQIGPRMTMQFGIDCSQGKQAIIMDLKTHQGQNLLNELINDSHLLVHNYLDESAERLSITQESLQQKNSAMASVQISAFGAPVKGGWEHRPAFDPVIQVIAGITRRYGSDESPRLHAIASCIDYLTGFSAAFASVGSLYRSLTTGQGGLARTSLCAATNYVQFPFNMRIEGQQVKEHAGGQQCLGDSLNSRIYQSKDGWLYLEALDLSPEILAKRLKIIATEKSFEKLFRKKTTADWTNYFSVDQSIACCAVNDFEHLRNQFALTTNATDPVDNQNGSIKVLHYQHPSGYQVATMAPSWMRIDSAPVQRQRPAPSPGMDTPSVLTAMAKNEQDIQSLYQGDIIRDSYIGVTEYLPS